MSSDSAVPGYLLERVRRPIPPNAMVVPGSTPVIAFGNARRATVATLGLNPSRVEFLDRYGNEFSEAQRRLETHRSLGVAQLADAPDDTVARVIAGCDGYFQRNPYWRWFRPLEQLLERLGVSYAHGSACHLDLIQWATDPVWRKLAPQTRQSLIAADAVFLRQQLTQERIATLLLNGRSVIETFTGAYGQALKVVQTVQERSVSTTLVAGVALNGVVVVGWSVNLQSSFGVTRAFGERLRVEVASLVERLARAGA